MNARKEDVDAEMKNLSDFYNSTFKAVVDKLKINESEFTTLDDMWLLNDFMDVNKAE